MATASSEPDVTFRFSEEEFKMPAERSAIRRNKIVAPPEGATSHLKTKSRERRPCERLPSMVGFHAPAPRNDLLPKLEISYAPVDRIRSAPKIRDGLPRHRFHGALLVAAAPGCTATAC